MLKILSIENHDYFTHLWFLFQWIDSGVSPDLDISRIGTRVMDELVKRLADVQIDDSEFACLKAIVFFDPGECKVLTFMSL